MNKLGMMGFALLIALVLPAGAFAHCDTMEGPVVAAAKQALETGKIDPVLIWVQPQDEGMVREAFQQTLSVRKQSPQAQQLADRYFFETLVRLHRAGEGQPYTGLKDKIDPAEAELIEAGDAALAAGSDAELKAMIMAQFEHGLDERFSEALAKRDYKNTAQGREYVEAYINYLHYAEGVLEAAETQHASEQVELAAAPWWVFWT